MSSLDRSFGRTAFGDDAANYHAARPAYPDAVWSALRQRAGLLPGIDILEIGAGTGLATGPLLRHAPHRLVAIEPDPRLAAFLAADLARPDLEILAETFETAQLPAASFDLVISATAFHWLDAVPALQQIAPLLRPGGHVALWWNVFGDSERADPFHDATTHLFAGHRSSPSQKSADRSEHGLDATARLADFAAAGLSADNPQFERWTLTLDPVGVRALYATYSHVTALPPAEREALLDSLEDVASRQFSGQVQRNMTTAIYTARGVR
jgi:SAM-dependent methyltransferase